MQAKQPNHSGVGGAKASNDKEWRNMPDPTATQSAEAGSSGLVRLHTKAKQNRSLPAIPAIIIIPLVSRARSLDE